MIKYFKRLFPKKNSVKENNEIKHNNSLSIILNEKIPIPLLQLNVQNPSSEAAIEFAKAILSLSHGVYYKDILELMVELSTQSIELNRFCDVVFLTLKSELKHISQQKQTADTDEPVVKPSHFGKNNE